MKGEKLRQLWKHHNSPKLKCQTFKCVKFFNSPHIVKLQLRKISTSFPLDKAGHKTFPYIGSFLWNHLHEIIKKFNNLQHFQA